MTIEAEERSRVQTEGPVGGGRIVPMQAEDHSDASPAVETPVEARQGFLGRPVLWVLSAGLILAIVAGAILGAFPV